MRIKKHPKVSLLFDRRKQSSATKPGYIEIFIFHNPKRVRIPTGVAVLPNQWKNDSVVKHEDSANLNRLIQSQLDEVRTAQSLTFDFGKEVLQKLIHCRSNYLFERHLKRLIRNKLIALDDYSLAVGIV